MSEKAKERAAHNKGKKTGKPAWNRGLRILVNKSYSEEEKIKARQSVLNKAVAQYSIEGELIRVYQSQRDVARITGYRREGIRDCCNGRQLSAYGYIWRKIDKDEYSVRRLIHG